MLNRLQTKWNVTTGRLLLILLTFAIGGSLTGLLGKMLINYMNISNEWLYGCLYVIMVTVIWPFMVLLVSIITGQFLFFRKYLISLYSKIIRR